MYLAAPRLTKIEQDFFFGFWNNFLSYLHCCLLIAIPLLVTRLRVGDGAIVDSFFHWSIYLYDLSKTKGHLCGKQGALKYAKYFEAVENWNKIIT